MDVSFGGCGFGVGGLWWFGEFVCWCEFCLLGVSFVCWVWVLFVGVIFACWWVLLVVVFVCWWVLVVVCGYFGFCWRCCNF